jgi:hypothetical protein
MKKIFDLALEVQDFCLSNQWKFCFIGGIALQRWGEPRITQDIDLTIFTDFRNEEKFVEILLSKYASRISEPMKFAMQNRVILLESGNKIGIDISLAGLSYEKELIDRAGYFAFFDEIELLTCTAEDLIVLKTFANRFKDWGDVESIVIRQKGKLDIDYILKHLQSLTDIKEEPEIIDQFQKLLKQRYYNDSLTID